MEEKILSVSEYINNLNTRLINCESKIIGEVSGASYGPTGHVYFSLKDEKDQSILKCVIFKSKYDLYDVEIKTGVKIVAFGAPNVHKIYGLSFVAETIEYAGEGILKKEYDRLKNKLFKEGIFDNSIKRLLPKYPQRIGVITALKGAVIADFSSNLKKFGFKISMVDSRVEGQLAVKDILLAINTLKKENIELLIIMRGGGSLESFMAFNNEKLTREIRNFPVPVITALGHHRDQPLATLASDLSVDTPSVAAYTLNESWEVALGLIEKYKNNIIYNYEIDLTNSCNIINRIIKKINEYYVLIFNNYKNIENELKYSLASFQNLLTNKSKDIDNQLKYLLARFQDSIINSKKIVSNVISKSCFGFHILILNTKKLIKSISKMIILHDPKRQLSLGYSIARSGTKIIKSVKDIKIKDDVNLMVVDGIINLKINNINKNNE